MNALLKIAASELFIKRHAKNQAENANKHARFVGTAAGVGTVAGVDLLAPRLTKKLSKNMKKKIIRTGSKVKQARHHTPGQPEKNPLPDFHENPLSRSYR